MSLTHAASAYSTIYTIASHRVCHTHPALDCSPEKNNYSIVYFRVKIIILLPLSLSNAQVTVSRPQRSPCVGTASFPLKYFYNHSK